MAPAGDVLATIETGKEAHPVIVLRSAATGAIFRSIDPCAACRYASPTFASDGRLAFLAREGMVTRVMTVTPRGNAAPATAARIEGIAQTPRWSLDAKHIAVLATIGASKEAGATQAGARQVGEIGETSDEQRIMLIPADGGAAVPLSPAGRYIYEYDWTPDGRGLVVTSAIGNGDNQWWVATLDRVDAATGAVTNIAAPPTQMNFPRVSPDGRTVASIGGLMSDFGAVGGDLYAVPITGGIPRNLTAGATRTFTSLNWGKAGLTASALAGAQMQIIPIDAERGVGAPFYRASSTIDAGDGRFAMSADGRQIAAVVSDFEHAPAIHGGARGALRKLTHDNDDQAPLVRARSIIWHRAGYDIQGWLLAPLTPPAPGTRAPIVVSVHGGPSSASVPTFISSGTQADLAKAGYYQFLPNPRGSFGQGEAFTRANIRDFGGGDLDDILAGVDAVENVAPVDEARLGLMGGSYGGFMAMWANTRTDRFKAIVASAGLSNWISYYGTNGIDQWMLPFFGKSAYDDPDAYWKVSAIRTIANAKTPTLVIVGERDIEVPPTQSVEYWHALKAKNVPTTLVIYADEGHAIRSPEHIADRRKRTMVWFEKYLGKAR